MRAIRLINTEEDLATVIQIMQDYKGLPADYVDAELVALANRLNNFYVATIDNDFTIYCGASKQRFENVIE